MGDFNIDQLPTLEVDPFDDFPDRSAHHIEERLRLETFAEQFRLKLHIPQVLLSVLGGPFADACAFAPVSRIPVGDLATSSLPSYLDHSLAQQHTLCT